MTQAKVTSPGPALRALVAFELRLQSRDFLAWLGFLVFLLLTFGYTSSGTIMLVGDLGDIPRSAPWAIAQAMAGVTAFGQVITAMTAATTVLRDVGTGTQGLFLSTPVPWRTYLSGRFLGTLMVLLIIYSAIPLGLALGSWQGAVDADGTRGALALESLLRPLFVLVVPNVLVVTAAFFAAGALSGGFTVILFVGLGFIGCWQSGLQLVAAGSTYGALLDPFGNAALTVATSSWDSAARSREAMPISGLLLWNRALWMSIAAVLAAVTLRYWQPAQASGRPHVALRRRPDTLSNRAAAGPSGPTPAPVVALHSLPPLRGAGWAAGFSAELRFGWAWVTRERGFAALLILAMLNAVANGWSATSDPSQLIRTLEFHARLFAILIATIYAGELVWRDRDVRASELLEALPISPLRRLAGRATGVSLGLLALPALLFVVATILPLLTRSGAPAPLCAARWLLGVSAPAFLGLLGISLAVHRLVNHKTVAHLLLISAWVLAIALGAEALARPWSTWGACAG